MMLASCVFAKANEREDIVLEQLSAPEMNRVEVLDDYYQGLAYDRDYLISSFMMDNAKKFNPQDFAMIRDILPDLSDFELQMLRGTDSAILR